MSNFIKLFCVIGFIFQLAACSHVYGDNGVIKNHDTDYLKAHTIEPMHMPPGYNSSQIEANYPVPEKKYPQNNPQVDLTPPDLAPATNTTGK